jgi:hypothetical protein
MLGAYQCRPQHQKDGAGYLVKITTPSDTAEKFWNKISAL